MRARRAALQDYEAAFGDAARSNFAETGGKLLRDEEAGQGIFERARHGDNFLTRFVREFETEAGDAGIAPGGEMCRRLLGFGAEDSVAAPDVGQHRVGAAGGVAQLDAVMLAGT